MIRRLLRIVPDLSPPCPRPGWVSGAAGRTPLGAYADKFRAVGAGCTSRAWSL